MTRRWVTCGTPTMPAILNPLTAACDRGYVPDDVRVLSNPAVAETVADACDLVETVVSAYGGDATVAVHDLERETDFEAIADFYRSSIIGAREAGDEVAVDVTPGRKFMSAIAFQAGVRFAADHVYYFHRTAGTYHGRLYPEIPRTATDLIDFTEVV